MLISRVSSPPSNVSPTPDQSQSSGLGERKASLSHLWRVFEHEMTEVARKTDFINSLDCNILDVSESDWMPSWLRIRDDGTLQLYLRNIDEPFATIRLSGSCIVGRVGQPLIQISSKTQTFLISCDAADFGHLSATLHAWTRLRPAGIPAKLWTPPVRALSDPEGEILKCEIEAHFTAYKPQMMRWAPFLARLKRSGEFELFNRDDELVFSLQMRNVLGYRIRHVDASLVGSNLVILLFPDMGGPESVYIRFSEISDFEDWFSALKAMSRQYVASSLSHDPKQSVRFYRTLSVSVSSCRREDDFHESMRDTYVDLCLNHWISSRTCASLDSEAASWGQSFHFLDPEPSKAARAANPVASPALELKLRRRSSGVASEFDDVLGSTVITDFDVAENYRWLDIKPGLSVSVSAVEMRTPVLDASYYAGMQKPVEDLSLRLATRLILSSPFSATRMCNLFTDLYRAQGRQTEWILSLIDEEVPKIDPKTTTVFRGTSPLTRALETHLQQQGADVLQRTIGRFIRKLLAGGDANLELDPARLDSSADVARNQVTVGHYLRYLWSLIQSEGVPRTFNRIFKHMRLQLIMHLDLSEDELAKQVNRTLSAFIFLRFYSPALLNPQLFGLADRILEPHHRRATILIAKLLQGFANGVRFGAKESWLVPMNSFIDEHESELHNWYAKISQDEDDVEEKEDFYDTSAHLQRSAQSETSPSGDRVPKELPFMPFMRNQLSNPNLVDEWAVYATLANTIVDLSAADDRFKDAVSSDELINSFYVTCEDVLMHQEKLLQELTAADSIESSTVGLTTDLAFNNESMLFGSNMDLLEPSGAKTQAPTVSASSSVGSRLGWFAREKPSGGDLGGDAGAKTTSKRRWTNVLRRSKH